MKKLFILPIFIFSLLFAHATGVAIVDASNSTYFTLQHTHVNVQVNNQVAVVTSLATYQNLTGEAVTFKYGFPLPSSASATQLRWSYDNQWHLAQFKTEPQDTSLPGSGGGVNYDLNDYLGKTPLYFEIEDTIAAGETVTIELTYVQLLSYSNSVALFDYPADYSEISNDPIDTFSFNANIYSDRTLQYIDFLSSFPHQAQIDSSQATITMTMGQSLLNDNFTFEYGMDAEELGLFSFSNYLLGSSSCDSLGKGYFAFLAEPNPKDTNQILPKDFVLIIDKSGSMGGQKIQQARDAASFIMQRLNFEDRFNIVAFESVISTFRSSLVPYNVANEQAALNYIDDINSGGGTNISGSFSSALPMLSDNNPDRVKIIIFFTDGQATSGITNTNGILNHVSGLVSDHAPNLNLFSFGIGNGANRELLNRLSNENNGLAAFVDNQNLYDAISNFYLKIQNPVLTNTTLAFNPNAVYEVYPTQLPNLYKGQQMLVVGRYQSPDSVTVNLGGESLGNPVNYEYGMNLTDTFIYENLFLTKLWAKAKIDDLMDQYYAANDENLKTSLKEEVIATSICYTVISPFTSFSAGSSSGNSGGGNTSLYAMEIESDRSSVKLLEAEPNPFQDRVRVKLDLPLNNPEECKIEIFDMEGRLVFAEYVVIDLSDPFYTWNGKTLAGQEATNGRYLITIKIGERTFTGKVVKAKLR